MIQGSLGEFFWGLICKNFYLRMIITIDNFSEHFILGAVVIGGLMREDNGLRRSFMTREWDHHTTGLLRNV